MNDFLAKRSVTLRIIGIYALVGFLWIYTSDTVLGWFVADPDIMVRIAIFKGSFYIILTSVLLYFLIGRYNKSLLDSEQALDATAIYLRTILDTEPECVKLLDADCKLIMMNRAGLEMIEADSLDQVKGQCVCPLITEPYRDAFLELSRQVFQGIPGTLEFETVGLKGRHVWLDTHAVPFRNEHGEITALLAITRNITEQKKSAVIFNARARLNEIAETASLDEMLQAALDEAEALTNSTIGFFHFLEEDQITLKLQAWSTNTLSNMCTAEGSGQHYPVDSAGVWVDCIHERKSVIHNDYASLRHKKGLPDGHAPIIREMVVPIIRDDRIDAIIGVGNKPDNYTDLDAEILSLFAATACDITLRKRAETALKESEARYQMFVENSIDVIFVLDMEGVFHFVSPAWEKHFGYSPSEVLHNNFAMFIHPDDIQPYVEYLSRIIATGEAATSPVYRVKHRDGSFRHFIANGSVYLEPSGSPRYLGVGRDISDQIKADEERLALERQLLHAQKLESLGVLAGGIAHDFNNILLAIIGNADLALMKTSPESPATSNLHKIEQAASRAADLARQMLAYSGKGKFVIEQIDLNRMLEEMLHMLEVSISKKIALRLNLTRPLSLIEADITQMNQVVMNLVINASEAIGDDGGVITITTSCVECDKAYLNSLVPTEHLPEGKYIVLDVADTGCGMSQETIAKIFDPFFTTKFTGRGLGMAAVHGIIKGHKGAIKVYSELRKGSIFKVLLPSSDAATVTQPVRISEVEWHGSGMVLLVDDEEVVRNVGQEMLEMLGFTVLTAKDGFDALEVLKHEPSIKIVLLDLTMPRMDGEQTFNKLRALNSGVKVVISSGYNEQDVTQKFVGKGLAGFIQKPYRVSVLRDVLRKIA